jgi:DNA repair ATPase RecN
MDGNIRNIDSRVQSVSELIERCVTDDMFSKGQITVFPNLGSPKSKLAVVFGENATGKSLILSSSKKYTGTFDQDRIETFSVSMRMRTTEGMGRGIMFMNEASSSTGVSSVRAVMCTFDQAALREHPVWIMLDEPDVGLSDRYAAALGAYIADQVNKLPAHIRGVLLVSHSRQLLKRLRRDLHDAPHEVAMGDKQSLVEYINRPEEEHASIADLSELRECARITRKFVGAIREANKASN